MRKNHTKIASDSAFLKEIDEVISRLREENRYEFLSEKLEKIRKISKSVEPLRMPQEKYISLQRVLDDTGHFSRSELGDRVADLAYYFAFIFRIPPLS